VVFFSGGGGLLLLMQPASIPDNMTKLVSIFMDHSAPCAIAETFGDRS